MTEPILKRVSGCSSACSVASFRSASLAMISDGCRTLPLAVRSTRSAGGEGDVGPSAEQQEACTPMNVRLHTPFCATNPFNASTNAANSL